ncbi:MAG: hypothetical protein ACYCW6_06970 [Candidatus Xenobia bacterium]
MLSGLQSMGWEELLNAATVAGIPREEAIGLGTPEKLLERILRWMAETSGAPGTAPATVEKHVLQWMADRWQVPYDPPDTLEERVFARLSEETVRHLMPLWKVAACMALLSRPGARDDELAFLERVAMRFVPSDEARQEMRRQWESITPVGPADPMSLLEKVQPELQQLKERKELATPLLVVCLIVALADSKLEREESKLYDGLATRLGMSPGEAAALRDKVNTAFWQVRAEIAPPGTERPAEIRRNSLQAAHQTLENTGVMQILEQQIRDGCLAGLHRTMFQDPDFQRGLKAWNRTKLLWPIGFAVGTCLYLKGRFSNPAQNNLAVLAFIAYASQKQNAARS